MKIFFIILAATFLQLNISFAKEVKSEACQQLVGKKFVLKPASNSGLQSVEFQSVENALTVTGIGVLGKWTCEQIENSDALGIHVNVQGWDTYITYSQSPYPHLTFKKDWELSFEYILETKTPLARSLDSKDSADYARGIYLNCSATTNQTNDYQATFSISRKADASQSPTENQKETGLFHSPKFGDFNLSCTYKQSSWACIYQKHEFRHNQLIEAQISPDSSKGTLQAHFENPRNSSDYDYILSCSEK